MVELEEWIIPVVITIVDNDDRFKVKRLSEMGFDFVEYNSNLNKRKTRETNKITEKEMQAIRSIPKPKKLNQTIARKTNKKLKKLREEMLKIGSHVSMKEKKCMKDQLMKHLITIQIHL